MGFLFEFFGQLLTEGVLALIMPVNLKLMSLIVPDKVYSEETRDKIKNILTTTSIILICVLFIGVFFLLPPDRVFNLIGKYMTFLPLSIIGVQILLCIIATVVRSIKRK